MRYVISVQGFRDVSVLRATAAEAVKKALDMIADGIKDVQITDTETMRMYGPGEFRLLLGNKPRLS